MVTGRAQGEARGQRLRGLDARTAIGGPSGEVNFIRRLAIEPGMRAIRVVPVDEIPELAPHVLSIDRHDDLPRAGFFDGANKNARPRRCCPVGRRRRSGGECRGVGTSAGTVRWAKTVSPCPLMRCLGAVPASRIVRAKNLRICAESGCASKTAHPIARREKVIDHHRHPPAERPALRHRKRQPGGPEAAAGRHGR